MLPIKTILHPTDFSEQSHFALRLARSLARDYHARLIVVHVIEFQMAVYGDGTVVPPPPDKEALGAKLRELTPQDQSLHVEHRLLEGNPALEILHLAQETKCDVIIMGTHGRTGLGRLLMGSVAENVVRRSPCPVLTVKTPLPETGASEKSAPETSGQTTGERELVRS